VKLSGNEKGMRMMAQMRRWALAPLVVMLAGASPSHRPVPAPIDRPGTPAADSVDRLARDVQRLESLRAVKNLQRAYAQYGQAGQWREMAALFAARGRIEWGGKRIAGQGAIAAWLGQRGHGGRPGTLATELIDEPLVTLSADGTSAQGRWMSLSLLGDGQGNARIEGGVYENDYVRGPRGWRIATARYFPQFEGGYAEGWTNIGGRDLPVVPYRITPDQTGIPVPPASGPAPKTGANLAEIQRRILALNDEDAVRNVQNAYGYYVDRKMWDDVVDLFAPDAVAEIGASGRQRGQAGVRRALARMGPAGLRHGELNDRPLFDTIVRVLPDGREAESRGIELGMLGDADKGTAEWEISVFRNRFVKRGGLWKLSELRVVPLLRADYYVGWGKGNAQRVQVPALLGPAPAASRAAIHAPAASTLADARRRLQRSLAYDAVENVSSAYGLYIDDFQWPQMGAIFAVNGNKQSPFVGYYLGRDRIMGAVNATWGPPPETRPGISYHWRTQPVIHVSHDARSANLRTRLFQPRTSKESSRAGQFYAAGFHGGMYPNDQLVLEDGIWRLWSLTIDEPYFFSVDWKSGWSAAKDPKEGTAPSPSALFRKYPPDIPITALGRREEGFRGGTGKTITWPGILPMWFHYRNPVSGRMPDNYWPDCVPCVQMPQASMTRHGYQMPPNGPEIDGVEVAR
jgi:hypothetical protein